MIRLEDDQYCFVCGSRNPCGLQISFRREGHKVISEFTPARHFQGYTNVLHGGVIAAVLDEIIVQAAMVQGFSPVTAEMRIRYKKPAPTERPLKIEGEVVHASSRLVEGKGRLLDAASGMLLAEADAKMVLIDNERVRAVSQELHGPS
ncbi:MAG TPA: PaaI family thioesterase [Dissulfurispiraceae bacterium]|nr:PaaI family thioesterase [Dissulfurispiraceae bacterium]